jgi:hypothetical protein
MHLIISATLLAQFVSRPPTVNARRLSRHVGGRPDTVGHPTPFAI